MTPLKTHGSTGGIIIDRRYKGKIGRRSELEAMSGISPKANLKIKAARLESDQEIKKQSS